MELENIIITPKQPEYKENEALNFLLILVCYVHDPHLMTYSAKGSSRRDLCVYLTQEEYEALENHIPDINHVIELTTPSTSTNRKPLLLCSYKWEIIPKK